ncbi:MAG: adenylate kinase [Thermoprotei archaeon]|nr:adenylate kinase [TACK group archaeon]
MAGKIVVLVGLPGVGKTTVLNEVLKQAGERGIAVKNVNFGDVMFGIATSRGLAKNRDDMRKLRVETQASLQAEAAASISKMAAGTSVIIDTHAIIKTPQGYWPGLPAHIVNALHPNHIAVVEAEPTVIQQRRAKDSGIRERQDDLDLQEIELSTLMNRAASMASAVLCGASVLFVRNEEGKAAEAASKIVPLLS